jgi:hypothetical protein
MPMISAESKISTSGARATQAAIWIACRRVIVCPASGSLIATTRASAASTVLPIAPPRGSSTSSSRKKFAISSTNRLA